jgi:predicted alternative tryptophan synthase beta-subunit
MEKSMWFPDQNDMSTHRYNIQADLPESLPPVLYPGTGKLNTF